MFRFVEIIIKQVRKIFQDFRFISEKRCNPKISDVILKSKISDRNTNYFAEFSPNSGFFVKFFSSLFFLSLIFGFCIKKFFSFVRKHIEMLLFRNSFNIQKKNIL